MSHNPGQEDIQEYLQRGFGKGFLFWKAVEKKMGSSSAECFQVCMPPWNCSNCLAMITDWEETAEVDPQREKSQVLDPWVPWIGIHYWMNQPLDFLLDANCCNKCPFLFRFPWVTGSRKLPKWCSKLPPPKPKPFPLGIKLIALLQKGLKCFWTLEYLVRSDLVHFSEGSSTCLASNYGLQSQVNP